MASWDLLKLLAARPAGNHHLGIDGLEFDDFGIVVQIPMNLLRAFYKFGERNGTALLSARRTS
jgi:hypothetical protein